MLGIAVDELPKERKSDAFTGKDENREELRDWLNGKEALCHGNWMDS